MEKFCFEKPSLKRKKEAIDYINEFYEYNSEINGAGSLHKYLDDYEGWLEKLERERNAKLTVATVPTETYFLVRLSDNKIVGMSNIRLELNDSLKKLGGNIGYSIRPTERRKGYNKINLYLGLKVCQAHGVKEAFLDCDSTNVGSYKTMEALGGRLSKEFFEDQYYHINIKDYLFDVDKCLEDHEEYEEYVEDIR